jgi:hypothetical protein
MKSILAIALVLASTLATAGRSSAQDLKIQAAVPFSFTVGSTTLPAGTYIIGSELSTHNVLSLTNGKTGVNVHAMGQPDQSNPKRADVLVFHKYGNQYFLSQIRSDGGSMNVDFAPTKAEKRARSQAEEASVPAADPILIALNW